MSVVGDEWHESGLNWGRLRSFQVRGLAFLSAPVGGAVACSPTSGDVRNLPLSEDRPPMRKCDGMSTVSLYRTRFRTYHPLLRVRVEIAQRRPSENSHEGRILWLLCSVGAHAGEGFSRTDTNTSAGMQLVHRCGEIVRPTALRANPSGTTRCLRGRAHSRTPAPGATRTRTHRSQAP